MKRFTILFSVLAIGIVAIATAGSRASKNTVNATAMAISKSQPPQSISNKLEIIDGAKNPEKIPDSVAYTLLFRFISGRQTEAERNRISAYIRQIGIGKQHCKKCPSTGSGDTDIDSLVAAAEEFQKRVSLLDDQAARVTNNHLTGTAVTPNERLQLGELQNQKEAIVADIVASLQQRLSADGLAKVRQHINDRMKRKIKISADREQS